jgi:hypothetical protein
LFCGLAPPTATLQQTIWDRRPIQGERASWEALRSNNKHERQYARRCAAISRPMSLHLCDRQGNAGEMSHIPPDELSVDGDDSSIKNRRFTAGFDSP